MIDEKTHSARYEIGGRVYVMRELTMGRLQKCEALKDGLRAAKGKESEGFDMFMDMPTLARLGSILLETEERQPVEITAQDVESWPVNVSMEMLSDFFALNPAFSKFLSTWLLGTLNWPGRESGPGAGLNSGSISPPVPPVVM